MPRIVLLILTALALTIFVSCGVKSVDDVDNSSDASDNPSGKGGNGDGDPYVNVTSDGGLFSEPQTYQTSADGSILQDLTGLAWQATDDGTTRSRADAISYCENLNQHGNTDWRLPSRNELASLVTYTQQNPAANALLGIGASRMYWSASLSASDSNNGWYARMAAGDVILTVNSYRTFVRCVRNESGKTPNSFLTLDNGAIFHENTRLSWQATDDNTTRHWQDAVPYCDNLDAHGKSDWRLPTIKELFSLTDVTFSAPAVDAILDLRAERYWSASNHVGFTDRAWRVNFGDGSASWGLHTNDYLVRCVRSGRD